ncbi:MAG TPA: LapA family protein [Solirubrobacterales bacterium]|nr:LapA family protein [Solirubrobacterales bacterium]
MADRTAPRRPAPAKEGRGVKQWLLIVCGVLLVLFFVLNLQKVKVHLLVATVEMPLVVALLIAAVLGLALGWAVPRLRRSPDRT